MDYLLGAAVGALLFSVTVIVIVVRRSRSRRAANMSYLPGPPPPTYRLWLIASAALGAIGLTGIIVCTALIMHTSGSQPNYNNPSVVAVSIKTQLQQRLSNKSGQYYEPGVTVTSVVCTPSGSGTDRCAITLSNGQAGTTTAVILENGRGFRTQ